MNNNRHSSSSLAYHQSGLTLVEILVALVISLFLIAGVIQLFIGTKQTYRFHDAVSRLQENGRLALDTMSMDIRMAGYGNPATPITGTGASITVAWNDNGAQTRAYSVGPRTAGGTAPTCPTAGTSLFFQRQTDATPQELIEGVQSMQIFYGVCNTDADGDGRNDTVTTPPGYDTAANVAAANNWPNVCSVRIYLLLVSLENNIVTQPQTVFFPPDTNTQVAVNDRCLRQAFSTTVAIRNRIP